MESREIWASLLAAVMCCSLVSAALEQRTFTQTYLSPAFELGAGDVTESYKSLEFPTGHIAMRNFFAEVVDEEGNSVPLYDVYLHHWVVFKLYVKKGFKELISSVPKRLSPEELATGPPEMMRHMDRMAFQAAADPKQEGQLYGTCNDGGTSQYFGLGSETRHTTTVLPAPYGLVSGNPAAVPEGYEEAWYLNIHAIDTRGALDTTSCLECLCAAYGVTEDSMGRPLSDGYQGGLFCCYDKTHCAVHQNYLGLKKKYFLKYEVTWVEWDTTVVPVRMYFLDVTDTRTSLTDKPHCLIEYEVPKCTEGTVCLDHRKSIAAVPEGGDVIYAVLHQHYGGLGGIVYDKDGVICSSMPIYGKGTEPGDEAGYVVGMSTCYPEIGSIRVESMIEIHFEASYSNEVAHTGVMSIFYLVVADPITYIQEVV